MGDPGVDGGPGRADNASMGRLASRGAVLLALLVAPAAQAAKLHVHGGLRADSLAQVTGAGSPRSLVLSKDGRYGPGDVVLGASVKRAHGGRFKAFLAVPETGLRGHLKLLGCKSAKPSRRSCHALGNVVVGAAQALHVATPVTDGAHSASGIIGRLGGSISTRAADGTTFTLTVPANDAVDTPVTLTPVTTLNPSGGFELLHGVMVEPVGDAPPGSTLTIASPAPPPAGTGVIAFGGADPSEAAFRFPGRAGASTTVTLTTFGGYGLARAGGKAARAASRGIGPSACPSAAGGVGLARTAAAGSQPLITCSTAADVLNAWQKAITEKGESAQLINESTEAIFKAIEQEATPILSRPPTEEGAAELKQVVIVLLGVERQSQLMDTENRAIVRGTLTQIMRYGEELYQHLCTGPVANSAVTQDYVIALLGVERQAALAGIETNPNGLLPTIEACFSKLHLKVSAEGTTSDHYSLAGSGMSGGITEKAGATIISQPSEGPLGPRYAIEGGNPSLQFSNSSASLEAPPAGVTASVGATTGKLLLEGNVFLAGHERIRCDKNKHFIIEHFAYLFLQPSAIWDDDVTVNVEDAGIKIPYPFSFMADGWVEQFAARPDPTKPLNPAAYIVMRVSPEHPESPDTWLPGVGSKAEKSASGSCTKFAGANECRDYKFSASFEGQGLPG